MNKIVNKLLLAGDKFMLILHLRQSGLLIVLVNCLLNVVKEFKNSEKQVIYL